MRKLSGILITIFLASVLLATAACTQVANNSNSESSKPANNTTASQNAGNKTDSSTGSIKIGSRPPGATVLLIADEGGEAGKPQMRGTSPTTITDLVPGKYTVHLELKGYKSFQKSVEVKAGETIPVTTDLQK
jgi:hypothetical protein